jgi:hypothetical protein
VLVAAPLRLLTVELVNAGRRHTPDQVVYLRWSRVDAPRLRSWGDVRCGGAEPIGAAERGSGRRYRSGHPPRARSRAGPGPIPGRFPSVEPCRASGRPGRCVDGHLCGQTKLDRPGHRVPPSCATCSLVPMFGTLARVLFCAAAAHQQTSTLWLWNVWRCPRQPSADGWRGVAPTAR